MSDYYVLYHHGIHGQKWGVRNGPPYPLRANAKAAAKNSAKSKTGQKQKESGTDSNKKKTTKSTSKMISSVERYVKEHKVTKEDIEREKREKAAEREAKANMRKAKKEQKERLEKLEQEKKEQKRKEEEEKEKNKKIESPDYSKARNKTIRTMSDDELQAAISRLDKEKRYMELYKSSKSSKSSQGLQMVEKMFNNSVNNIGTQLITYVMGSAVNKMAKKEIVNPKKGQRDKK